MIKPVNITVRTYHPHDAQALANIYYNTIHKINVLDYTPEQIQAWAPESSLNVEGWMKKFERTQPLIASADGHVVGFAEFESDGHIDCFYCHHEWIGRGVGRALIDAIFQKASFLGIKHIFAEVSITAKPSFERWGFSVVTEQQVVLRGVHLTNFKMQITI